MTKPIPDLYGPNKEAVAAVLDRAARMTLEELLRAATFMDYRTTDAWEEAQGAEVNAFEELGLLSAWEVIWRAADRATQTAAEAGDWSEVRAEIAGEASPAPDEIKEAAQTGACGTVAAAALAAVVKDRLSEEHYHVLTAPWREADLDVADRVVGARVTVPDYAVPEDWARAGGIVAVNAETVVVELDDGHRQELPTSEVTVEK